MLDDKWEPCMLDMLLHFFFCSVFNLPEQMESFYVWGSLFDKFLSDSAVLRMVKFTLDKNYQQEHAWLKF